MIFVPDIIVSLPTLRSVYGFGGGDCDSLSRDRHDSVPDSSGAYDCAAQALEALGLLRGGLEEGRTRVLAEETLANAGLHPPCGGLGCVLAAVPVDGDDLVQG